ncbi:tyrosine-type recombinase/integrase [Yersinia enterocolitica]
MLQISIEGTQSRQRIRQRAGFPPHRQLSRQHLKCFRRHKHPQRIETQNTFRHSYAMHLLYAGVPLKVLQSLMGHKSLKSTEVYTRIFALDVAARHRVQFSMPGQDAVAMLKQQEV